MTKHSANLLVLATISLIMSSCQSLTLSGRYLNNANSDGTTSSSSLLETLSNKNQPSSVEPNSGLASSSSFDSVSSEALVSSFVTNSNCYSPNDNSSFAPSYNESQPSSNPVSSKEEIPLLPDDEKQKDQEPQHLFDDFFGKFTGTENNQSLLFSSEQEIYNYFVAAYEGLTMTGGLEKKANQETRTILDILPANFFDYYNLIFTSTFNMSLGVNDLYFDGLSFENGHLQIFYLNNPNKIISVYPAHRTYFDVFSVGKNQTINSIEVIGYCSYNRSIDDATYTKTVFTND